ncbi:hypothetical protein ACFL1G_08015 [Planctomycetota bacterium]
MEYESQEVISIFAVVFVCFVWFVCLVIAAVTTWAYCKMFSKAGYHWALGLLMLVPIANLVMMLYLGFSDWPILKEVRQLRGQNQPEQMPA